MRLSFLVYSICLKAPYRKSSTSAIFPAIPWGREDMFSYFVVGCSSDLGSTLIFPRVGSFLGASVRVEKHILIYLSFDR
jgi:hypothetical protein